MTLCDEVSIFRVAYESPDWADMAEAMKVTRRMVARSNKLDDMCYSVHEE